MKRSQPETCINCDYRVNYEFQVREVAVELVQQWNATHEDEDDKIDERDWDIFEEQAVEVVSKYDDTDTQCDDCYDGDDY